MTSACQKRLGLQYRNTADMQKVHLHFPVKSWDVVGTVPSPHCHDKHVQPLENDASSQENNAVQQLVN